MTRVSYCPWSARTFAQALLSRARFCLRHASTTWSPSFIRARQNRDTSRTHSSCPGRCCAEAAEAIKKNGRMKRILAIVVMPSCASMKDDQILMPRACQCISTPQSRDAAHFCNTGKIRSVRSRVQLRVGAIGIARRAMARCELVGRLRSAQEAKCSSDPMDCFAEPRICAARWLPGTGKATAKISGTAKVALARC
jgi:hypothetical protein